MKRSFLRLSLLAVVALVLVATVPATAQEGQAKAALEKWIEQANGASQDELKTYLLEAFSEAFLEQVSVDQMLQVHQQLKGAGALEIGKIESETDTAVVALLSSVSGTWLRAQVRVAGDPSQFEGFLIQPASAPSTEEPKELEWKSLDELAKEVGDDAGLPGVAVAWARLGEQPSVGVAGVRAQGGSDAIEAKDRFHIGSITKSVTSTALGALVEKGKLSWSASLAELLPAMEMNDIFAQVELQTLLRHRARVPQHQTFNDEEMSRLNGLPGTPTEQRAAYAAEVLAMEPIDDGFHYSNAGYAVAGLIGEKASDKGWEQLVADEVFGPLGLESCGIGWPATEEHPNQPRGHFGGRGSRRVMGLDEYRLGAFMRPAGDVHCSVGDLARSASPISPGCLDRTGFSRLRPFRSCIACRRETRPTRLDGEWIPRAASIATTVRPAPSTPT